MLLIIATEVHPQSGTEAYPWLDPVVEYQTLEDRISPPPGYARVTAGEGSFALWLRRLPLKPPGSRVMLFNGEPKPDQTVHHAVIALDTGSRDLQQCADAVIRLRAEYLFFRKRLDEIRFRFTSGHPSAFIRWARGERPVVRGNRVNWRTLAAADSSHASLRRYLTNLFIYAGSYSLEREMIPKPIRAIQIGDVFIQGGFPGHAVLVVDQARLERTGKVVFLLAQSYMPAQEVHVLRNPDNPKISPWYDLPPGGALITPEWTFRTTDLRSFPSRNSAER